jgi:uncharacterized delta-60 repeat protein
MKHLTLKSLLLTTLFLQPLLFILNASAQPGTLDLSFNSSDIGFGNGDGFNNAANVSVLQPDGKIITGGYFTFYNGDSITRIARLNSDATRDVTFNPGAGANDIIKAIALQPDGKILIGGQFLSYDGTAIRHIARLNANGSLDNTFSPGTAANGDVTAISIQPDGKIVAVGLFTSYNGIGRNHIARINTDGSLDATFNPGTGANDDIFSIAIQPDGQILIGGDFTTYNGTTRNRIARVNASGPLDVSFNPGTGANATVNSIVLQPDGKILIGGIFTTYNATSRNRVARLNTNGTLDTGFNPGTGANNTVHSVVLQPDGKIFLAGNFTSYNGVTNNYVVRINSNGTIDNSFVSGSDHSVSFLTIQPDGKILIHGNIIYYNGTLRKYLARINADGQLDHSFNAGSGSIGEVVTVALQADSKIIIGGDLTSYNGIDRNHLARINTDGTLDLTFNPGSGSNYDVDAVAIQQNGKILIAGGFTSYNGVAKSQLARINTDGSLDNSFFDNPGIGPNGSSIETITIQPDGKIIITGLFTMYNGVSRINIARLNEDGTLDASFNPGTGTSNPATRVFVQPDGKIIIAGFFTTYNGTARNRIARLNADGSLDNTFNPGTGANNYIWNCALQPDGKIIIVGFFVSYNGTNRNHIARLNTDGTLDTSFDPGSGTDVDISTITLQPNGKILIAGGFASYNGNAVHRIARLNMNGSFDQTFIQGTGFNDNIFKAILVQPDGNIIAGGNFTSYNGIGRNRLARLFGDGVTVPVPALSEWGMLLLAILMVFTSTFYLKKL